MDSIGLTIWNGLGDALNATRCFNHLRLLHPDTTWKVLHISDHPDRYTGILTSILSIVPEISSIEFIVKTDNSRETASKHSSFEHCTKVYSLLYSDITEGITPLYKDWIDESITLHLKTVKFTESFPPKFIAVHPYSSWSPKEVVLSGDFVFWTKVINHLLKMYPYYPIFILGSSNDIVGYDFSNFGRQIRDVRGVYSFEQSCWLSIVAEKMFSVPSALALARTYGHVDNSVIFADHSYERFYYNYWFDEVRIAAHDGLIGTNNRAVISNVQLWESFFGNRI